MGNVKQARSQYDTAVAATYELLPRRKSKQTLVRRKAHMLNRLLQVREIFCYNAAREGKSTAARITTAKSQFTGEERGLGHGR